MREQKASSSSKQASRKGIECLREGKASKQFQQTSLIIVKVFIEKDGG